MEAGLFLEEEGEVVGGRGQYRAGGHGWWDGMMLDWCLSVGGGFSWAAGSSA